MPTEEIIKYLDTINQKMNGIIGRLTPGIPTPKDTHGLALEAGNLLDELINKLL